mmetsp:Transcript_18349/g.27969  ORF Transcript_18349/g.27969 Transcript_18349/m.27969 type:complete len:95 (-) Transcript_18349:563-847(-)
MMILKQSAIKSESPAVPCPTLRLKQLHYFFFHLNCIQHPIAPAQATFAHLNAAWKLHEMEEEQNDRIPETEAVTKLRQVIENLENYLRQKQLHN